MEYTTLGKTGLRVSVAGLGTGGFSRMGLKTGKSEDESARLVLDAVDLGITFIDTAPSYGTEGVVGRALKSLARDKVVVATKTHAYRDGKWTSPEELVASIDKSLRLMCTASRRRCTTTRSTRWDRCSPSRSRKARFATSG
jgi:L-galactose dehydrogenase